MSYWIVRAVKTYRNGELFYVSAQRISSFADFDEAWGRWKAMYDKLSSEEREQFELEILSDTELANLPFYTR